MSLLSLDYIKKLERSPVCKSISMILYCVDIVIVLKPGSEIT